MSDSKSDPKDGESFFRKVVRFVANPATDWQELNSRQDLDSRNLEFEKSELKAMIERKRRNDFVRKREFDMLRKVRREGLSGEQLAALAGSSRIDDSEVRMSDARADAPQVKAKIDEIEQQMVGDGFSRRSSTFFGADTQPGGLPPPRASRPAPLGPASKSGALPPELPAEAALPELKIIEPQLPPAPAEPPAGVVTAAPAAAPASPVLPPVDMMPAMEVSEVVHDPELDEAVIAFANADFDQCEASLVGLTGPNGSRVDHPETWMVLFDLFRATGQQHKFEQLAAEFPQRFGLSSPQWFSLPRMVAEAAAAAEEQQHQQKKKPDARHGGEVSWVCPEVLDTEAVARLRSQTLQLPLPWIFDWGPLRRVEPEAASHLSQLFRQWAKEPLQMHWLNGDTFFQVLNDVAPTGLRDADPIYWTVRLDALTLANRPDQFDETAIDYCVTYEVSPPQWEPAKCNVRVSGVDMSTRSPHTSPLSEAPTGFLESRLMEDETGAVRAADVELTGQLVGDIGPTLKQLDQELGTAPVVNVSCARLIRVDFIAAGDLLNWVLTKRSENRAVSFADAHRLVALFFGAMGINEHARVRVGHV
jgi:hypothetical protein